MAEQIYLAVDLGASSGRVLAGRFGGQGLELEEVHRFGNGPVAASGHLYWDILQIWTQILEGLKSGTRVFIDLPPWAKKEREQN